MAHPSFNNIGAYIKGFHAVASSAIAGGAGDNAEVDGEDIDRKQDGVAGLAMSAVFHLVAKATLADTKTAVYKMTIQDSADGVTYADVAAALQPEGAANSTVLTLTGETGGTTEVGSYEHEIDLISLQRYIRAQVHIDLNAANTDIGLYAVSCQLGGFTKLAQDA